MKLNKLRIENFRCFKELEIPFNSSLSVLVGINSAGKSSILNAATIAIGSFLLGIDGASSKSILRDDVRHITTASGTLLELEPQFPSVISAEGVVQDQSISWSRSLNSSSGRTTSAQARPIYTISSEMQKRIRSASSDREDILPLLAVYGTDRIASKVSLTESEETKPFSRFLGYLNALDTRSSERFLLDWLRKLTYTQIQDNIVVPELQAIKEAVLSVYNFADQSKGSSVAIDFRYNIARERLEFILDSEGKRSISLYSEMSDGYRSIIGLVADIARRMGTLNPQLAKHDSMLTAPGIVLIDEIDQHLHPSWQQHVLDDLRKTFPNVQFIVTTHSPSIINSVPVEHLIFLDRENIRESSIETYGRDANSILKYVMNVSPRPKVIEDLFAEFNSLLDAEKLIEAKVKLDELESHIGEMDPEISRGRMFLELEMMD